MPSMNQSLSTTPEPELAALEDIFDLSAACSDEPLGIYTAGSICTPSKLWEPAILGSHPIRFDGNEHLESTGRILIDRKDHGGSTLSSPHSLPGGAFSHASSVASTPSAAFSSATMDFSPLPDDLISELTTQYESLPYFVDTTYESPAAPPHPLPDKPPVYLTDTAMDLSTLEVETMRESAPTSPFDQSPPSPSHDLSFQPCDDVASLSRSNTMDMPNHTDLPHSRGSAGPGMPTPNGPVAVSTQLNDIDSSPLRRSTRISACPRRTTIYCELDEADMQDPGDAEYQTNRSKRKNDDCDYDESDSDHISHENLTSQRSKRPRSPVSAKDCHRRRKASVKFPCMFSGCKKTFGRENDAKRHWTYAAVHEADRLRVNMSPPASQCEFCGESLSRDDARKRHERDRSCGKRSGRKKEIKVAIA